MTEEKKKEEHSLAKYALAKGQAINVPALQFIQQRVENIEKEIIILSGFISSTINDIKEKEKEVDDAEEELALKREKEEEELNWKDGPHEKAGYIDSKENN
tara:strand:+ start:255 stop:557 length:303 start_codon:yes stop_codon:yes gene_type:complete